MYFQGIYALQRLKEKAAADPSILISDAMKAAAAGDMQGVMAGGEKGLVEILNASCTAPGPLDSRLHYAAHGRFWSSHL